MSGPLFKVGSRYVEHLIRAIRIFRNRRKARPICCPVQRKLWGFRLYNHQLLNIPQLQDQKHTTSAFRLMHTAVTAASTRKDQQHIMQKTHVPVHHPHPAKLHSGTSTPSALRCGGTCPAGHSNSNNSNSDNSNNINSTWGVAEMYGPLNPQILLGTFQRSFLPKLCGSPQRPCTIYSKL